MKQCILFRCAWKPEKKDRQVAFEIPVFDFAISQEQFKLKKIPIAIGDVIRLHDESGFYRDSCPFKITKLEICIFEPKDLKRNQRQ